MINMALMKHCRCGKQIPISDRCCKECAAYYHAQDAKYHKKYDKSNRTHSDFYDSTEWKELRALVKRNYKGIDIYDYYINNQITTATTVHHIVELRDDYTKRLDINNLIAVSGSNHSKIHRMYFRKKKETQELLRQLIDRAKKDGIG